MTMDKLFEETKIKLVMKVRGVSRAEAVQIVRKRRGESKVEKGGRGRGRRMDPGRGGKGGEIMSAEEFFGTEEFF